MSEGRDQIRARKRRDDESVMMITTPKIGGVWRLWLLGLVFLVMIAGSVYLLFFSDHFKVKKVVIEGARDGMEKDIEEMITWETDYMILFNESNFKNSIIERWEELSSVTVNKDWPMTINVGLTFEEPKIVWNSEGRLYLLNEGGVVLRNIEEAERLEKYAVLPVVGDLSSLPVEDNVRIVSSDFVQFVYDVRDNIDMSVSMPVEAFEVKETTFELRVRFKDGFEVFFDTLRDPVTQVEKLNIFIKSGTRVDEYIDLRVPGKVYYK